MKKKILNEEFLRMQKLAGIQLNENKEDEYQKIRQEIMDEWNLEDEDMDEEENEGEVNREADKRFYEKFGKEYMS